MTVLQDIHALRQDHGWTYTRLGAHYRTSEREVRRWIADGGAPEGLAPPLVLNWGTAMVVNDTQFPFFDPALWEVTCQIARDAEVDRLIWDGDMIDFPQLSRFEHNPYKLKTAKEDVREFHRLVRDPFIKEVPTLTQEDWNDGNHEFRYEKYVEANASAVGEFPAPRDFMELPDSVSWRRYGKAVGTWLGPDLLVAHGWMARKHSGYSAKGSLDDTGCSVIVGHCFDDKTEILTPTGWETHDQLKVGDPVLTMDPDGDRETKALAWNTIEEVHRYDSFDELVHIRSPMGGIDVAVTGGHGLMVPKRGPQQGWQRRSADDAYGHEMRHFPLAGMHDEESLPLTDDQIRFVAWVMAEGHLQRGKYLRIAQSDYDGHLEALESCLDGIGADYSKTIRYRAGETDHGQHRNHDAYRYGVPYESYSDWLFKYLTDEKAPTVALAGMSTHQMGVFIDTYVLADGNVNKSAVNSRQISANRRDHVDFLQQLAVRSGHRSTISERPDGMFTLTLNSRDRGRVHEGGWSREPYEGTVWCVSVANGTLVVRRNGKTAITANTHRVGMHALTDTQGPKVAYEVGHMCDPEYLPKAVEGHQNWQQVAGTLVRYEREGNAFSVDLNMVTRGGRVLCNDREYIIDRSGK